MEGSIPSVFAYHRIQLPRVRSHHHRQMSVDFRHRRCHHIQCKSPFQTVKTFTYYDPVNVCIMNPILAPSPTGLPRLTLVPWLGS